jgi:virulence-associated protein VagC
MRATAKVFNTGNSQAIRLTKAFFAELKAMPITEEFLQPRNDAPSRNPLEEWMV